MPPAEKIEILNAKNHSGSIALHIAANAGHMEVIRSLLDAGLDYEITNIIGDTARDSLRWHHPQKLEEYDKLVVEFGKPKLESKESARARVASEPVKSHKEEQTQLERKRSSTQSNTIRLSTKATDTGSFFSWWISLFGESLTKNEKATAEEKMSLLTQDQDSNDSGKHFKRD